MTQTRRLQIVLALNSIVFLCLIKVGFSSHSLSVLAMGGDYLLDSGAILMGLFAIYLRDRSDRNGEKSRATTLVALFNASLLLVLSSSVIFEALLRLSNKAPEISATPVIWVSVIAALVMCFGVYLLNDDESEGDDLHMQSVLLDTLMDSLSAAAIAITATIIMFTHRFLWVDSALAILISAVVIFQALKLLEKIRISLRG